MVEVDSKGIIRLSQNVLIDKLYNPASTVLKANNNYITQPNPTESYKTAWVTFLEVHPHNITSN